MNQSDPPMDPLGIARDVRVLVACSRGLAIFFNGVVVTLGGVGVLAFPAEASDGLWQAAWLLVMGATALLGPQLATQLRAKSGLAFVGIGEDLRSAPMAVVLFIGCVFGILAMYVATSGWGDRVFTNPSVAWFMALLGIGPLRSYLRFLLWEYLLLTMAIFAAAAAHVWQGGTMVSAGGAFLVVGAAGVVCGLSLHGRWRRWVSMAQTKVHADQEAP